MCDLCKTYLIYYLFYYFFFFLTCTLQWGLDMTAPEQQPCCWHKNYWMTYLLVYVFTFTLHKCRCVVFYFDLLSFFKELILFLNFTKSTLNVQRIQIIDFLTNICMLSSVCILTCWMELFCLLIIFGVKF